MSDDVEVEVEGGEGQPVVLLHGLGRTRLAMLPLARTLARQGYAPINVGYFGPAGLAYGVAQVGRILAERLAPYAGRQVHFVTHSMGGIVARAYLSGEGADLPPGRLVQLAPPNQGAWLADAVGRVPLVGRVRALRDLGTAGECAPLPTLEGWEVGVVAGRSFGPWHRGEPSDGVVRVSETYLPAARDWILLEHFHTIVMAARDAQEQVACFLREGRFGDQAPRLERTAAGEVVVRTAAGEVEALRTEPSPRSPG